MNRLLRGALVILAFSTAALHAQQTAAPYRLVRNWGVLPGGATGGEVPGMAIDAKGKIFAFHRAEPPIVELDASGKILQMTSPSPTTATSSWPMATSTRAS